MAVRIGHARIDENGHAYGGQPGDQGREVAVTNYYNGKWSWMARTDNAALAERSAWAMEEICKNPMVGYNQKDRNSLREELRRNAWDPRKIDTPCNTDCSACVSAAVAAGGGRGFPYGAANSPYTGNLHTYLEKAGYEISQGPKFLTGPDYLRRGDILVVYGKHGRHAVMVLDDGPLAYADGKPVEPTCPVLPDKPAAYTVTVTLPTLRRGQKRWEVGLMQRLLLDQGYRFGRYQDDGSFGPATKKTVEKFQADHGLTPDGVCGPDTWKEICEGEKRR